MRCHYGDNRTGICPIIPYALTAGYVELGIGAYLGTLFDRHMTKPLYRAPPPARVEVAPLVSHERMGVLAWRRSSRRRLRPVQGQRVAARVSAKILLLVSGAGATRWRLRVPPRQVARRWIERSRCRPRDVTRRPGSARRRRIRTLRRRRCRGRAEAPCRLATSSNSALHIPRELRPAPPRQGHPVRGRQLTGEGFDLDDDLRGENPRPARAVAVVQPREPSLEEALAPLGDHFSATVQLLGDLVVSPSVGGQEDHLGSQDL